MKKTSLIPLVITFFLLFIEAVNAEVKLPAIVSSNMVLQRNTTIQLWGWADAKEKISIEASWLKEPLNMQADQDGNWRISVKTTDSKMPQTIKITSKTSDILLEDILFGEVWLCSGQSNMEMPMRGFEGQPILESAMAIATGTNTKLRLFTVEKKGNKTPLKDVDKYRGWQAASPESVKNFSAVAYFYGQQLQQILDVPVGMIHTSWGGSRIEAWISNDVMSTFKTVNLDAVDISKNTNQIPTVLFNAMINPLIPYTIKGVLWYQGESNRNETEDYKKLFPAMVKNWRTLWNVGDFPFYYVQIAPYFYNNEDAFQEVDNSAFMREAQLQCLDLTPNSGIAITTDLGDRFSIHPPKKKEVADRLLFNALNQTYGYKAIDYASPIYESSEIKDGGMMIKFKNAENGLYSFNDLEGFEVAGADKVFYPAEAKIINRKNVLVKSEKVPNPVAVRYAWRNWIVGTLYGTNLLPASSFRTDNWTDATQFKN